MADLGSSSWSEIDASNNAAPPNGWPEGMAPSDVNNSARAQMGGEKRWWDRSNSTQTTTGTSTAYVLTYAAAESALYDGEETSFVLHTTCGATPTLNRDELGPKYLRRFDRDSAAYVAVAAGDYVTNQVLRVRYNLSADRYDVISDAVFGGDYVTLAGNNDFTGINQFQNALNEYKGADIASAATTDIGTATGNYVNVNVTGTTTITGLGTVQAGTERTVTFTGALTLTHNGTSLILPGAANILTAAGDVAVFRSLGSGNWKCITYTRTQYTPGGGQIVSLMTGAYATGTTPIPLDDTIPQNTEGDEYMSLAITPRNATSKLEISVTAYVTSSDGSQAIVALFQDSTANALMAGWGTPVTNGAPMTPVTFTYVMTSGTTSSTTFKVRAGCAGTIGFNGSGTRYFGGVMGSSIVIRETL